ncbi:hypothetical protein [Adhaeretor mobilis]|uniref:Uncharacterized protein n=1 Tax=Adhaeretor mobilis TaxID=1930276 RepID=A0A517MVI6_9BACT|nr:hypothetical protein [Adhaeretor mobilis]QDS98893.1 hypothetical protein HG15A2_21810 [Adhaeretor mobilis]
MSIKQALAMVVGCFAIGVTAGGGIGWVVGKLSPELAFALLPLLDDTADGLAVCTSLGLINGAWAGIAVGIAVTAVVAWFESRKLKH